LLCTEVQQIYSFPFFPVEPLSNAVMDLRIGQIGNGLGPHATLSYDDSLLT